MAARTKTYRVTVRGKGTFPIDMLRYDRAVPTTEVDAGLIEDTFGARFPREPMSMKVDMPRPPTTARWESFSWKVVDTEERTS